MAWLQTFFGSHEDNSKGNTATPLDVVTYTASLASNPQEIDPLLDKVREVSSRLEPGQPLSAADEEILSSVYNELEHYLVEKERVRKFTLEDVRNRVRAKFPNVAAKVIGA